LGAVAALALASAGCAALILGAGVGTGTYSYIQGELARAYPAGYAAVLDTSLQVLQDLGMPADERRAEGDRTVIESRRKDGTPVTVKVRILTLDVTELAVRTGTVGIWDRGFSEQFHAFVAERLK
jgi:hypothetical protein